MKYEVRIEKQEFRIQKVAFVRDFWLLASGFCEEISEIENRKSEITIPA